MTDALGQLSASTLSALADRLERGTLSPPYSEMGLEMVAAASRGPVAADLEALRKLDVQPAAASVFLRALAKQRAHAQGARDGVELVWTGPDVGQSHARDAAVVAAEMFARAERSVLVATYALHNGHRVLRSLAERMDEREGLEVTLVVNVERARGDTRDESEIIRDFSDRFVTREWSGKRLPDVYFDPRALVPVGTEGRASMHAKCIVVDKQWVLVTSANFTEAAQQRNIEVGLVLSSPAVGMQLHRSLEHLVETRSFRRLGLVGHAK